MMKKKASKKLTLKQLDAQFSTGSKIKKWFSSLFISIGYISLCILTSIYLSKALSSIATHGINLFLVNKNSEIFSVYY